MAPIPSSASSSSVRRLPMVVGLVLAAAVLGPAWWASGLPEAAAGADDVPASSPQVRPLRALMFTGGCCHDYEKQKFILSNGISERIPVEWEIVHEGGTGTAYQFPRLKEDGWWKGYDVVVYNICFSHETDGEYIDNIAKVHHEGVPAVALHCTMHTYHWKVETDAWEQFLGVTSPRHGAHAPITVTKVNADHPVMRRFPAEWVTPKGELYHIEKVWPTATVLAEGTMDGGKSKHQCVWVNDYGKGRVFGTTIGHHNETMAEPVYLDLLARGILWATGHLQDDGEPESGFAAPSN